MIIVVAPLPPLKTGIALYSHKLYTRVGKYIPLVILANEDSESIKLERVRTKKTWDFNNPLSVLKLLKSTLSNRSKIIHIQLAYTWIKGPLTTILLTLIYLAFIKIIKMKTIVTLHGVVTYKTLKEYSDKENLKFKFIIRILSNIYTLYYRFLLKLCDSIIVHNNEIKNKFLELTNGWKLNHKIVVIPHGVDEIERVAKNKPTRKDKIKLLFLGFIRRNKGLEELAYAISRLDKKTIDIIEVTIAGSPHISDDVKYLYEIKNLINKLDLQKVIRFMPKFIPERELSQLITEADIIVLPYTDLFYEASGVLSRIMRYGKPVIATSIPKFSSDLKNNYDAILIKPGKIDDLTLAIRKLVYDEKLRDFLGRNLRKKGRGRLWEVIAKQHIKLYLKLIQ